MKKFVKLSIAVGISFALVGIANAQTNPLFESLRIFFPFNENAADESGMGFEPTLQAAALAQDLHKKLDRSCGFDGLKNGMMKVEHDDMLNPTAMTLATWLRGGENLTGNARIIDKMNEVAKTGYSMWLNEANGNSVVFDFFDSAGIRRQVQSKVKIEKEKWHHVAATFNGLRMKLFVDGKLEDELLVASNIKPSQEDMMIANGTDGISNFPFDGALDEIRLHAEALNDFDIERIWNREKTDKNTFGLTDNTLYVPGLVIEGQTEGEGLELALEMVLEQSTGGDLLFRLTSALIKE
jgi:hypothetical protein